MKAIAAFLFTLTFLFSFSAMKLGAQTMAIGHVSAEVVESVSASSLAITGFDLKGGNELAALNNNDINLGAIKINSGSGIACNVVMKAATLSDANGNGFTIEPTITSFSQGDALGIGSQTLRLIGKAHLAKGQASGLYQGNYTMVFAFN